MVSCRSSARGVTAAKALKVPKEGSHSTVTATVFRDPGTTSTQVMEATATMEEGGRDPAFARAAPEVLLLAVGAWLGGRDVVAFSDAMAATRRGPDLEAVARRHRSSCLGAPTTASTPR